MDLDLFEDILISSETASDRISVHSTLLSNSHNSTLTNQPVSEHPQTHSGVLPPASSTPESSVISKIESILESIASCILEEKDELTIHLKTRKPATSKKSNSSKDNSNQLRAVTFPGKKLEEGWKFTVLLRILELSHAALVKGAVITKREIYYCHPDLFLQQRVVDRYIDDLAHTLGTNRSALNIVAASKGLITGSLHMTQKNKHSIDCTLENDGILMPDPNSIQSFNLSQTNWILIIEKEATFRSLAATRYWSRSKAGKGVLITAKGYPDIQTRSFLHNLSDSTPCPPIYCLVDFDPHGINILSTYKYNSAHLAHETDLAVPGMQWLGVKSSDIMYYQNESRGQELLDLTARDWRMAVNMLERLCDAGLEVEWRREIQVMLMLGVKAEIQIVNGGDGDQLCGWLDGKLQG